MNIEIYTDDKNLVFELLGKSSAKVGDSTGLENQILLTYKGSLIRKAIGFPEIAQFALTFGSGVGAGLVANWLYDKLRGKKITRIVIERTEVKLNEGEIEKVINEKAEYDKHS